MTTNTPAPIPTGAEAIAYVRAYFARADWGAPAHVCGTVQSRCDAEAREVLFVFEGDPTPCRFIVWNVPTGDNAYTLYGEW